MGMFDTTPKILMFVGMLEAFITCIVSIAYGIFLVTYEMSKDMKEAKMTAAFLILTFIFAGFFGIVLIWNLLGKTDAKPGMWKIMGWIASIGANLMCLLAIIMWIAYGKKYDMLGYKPLNWFWFVFLLVGFFGMIIGFVGWFLHSKKGGDAPDEDAETSEDATDA
jgi:membrane protease YdiL (CAAX protease family)